MAPPTKTPRQRQTQLSFSPASPASKYASVVYEGSSPSKRRRIDDWLQHSEASAAWSSSAAGPSNSRAGLATPLQSSQLAAGDGDAGARLAARTQHSRRRQQDVDQADGSDLEVKIREDALTDTDSDSNADELAPSKRRRAAGRSTRARRRGSPPASTNIFERAPVISPRKGHKEPVLLSSSDDGEDVADQVTSDDSDMLLSGPAKKLAGRKTGGEGKARRKEELPPDLVGSDDHDDEDELASLPSQEDSSSFGKEADTDKLAELVSSDKQSAQHEDDDDDEVLPVTPVRQRRLTQRSSQPAQADDDSDEVFASTQRRKARGETFAMNGSEDNDESVDDVMPSTQTRRKLRRRSEAGNQPEAHGSAVELSSETEKGSSINVTPTRKQTRKQRRSSSEQAELDEVAEDAKDLQDSLVFNEHDGGKLRGANSITRTKANARRSKLDLLKARREGRVVEQEKDSESEYEEYQEEDPIMDGSEGDDADGFVVDGDDGGDVDEGADMLPLEMMRHGQRGLKEHFIYVVKGMLQARLNPGGAAEEQHLYNMSVQRVGREAEGLADRLVSTAWVSTFTRALRARPDYQEMPIAVVNDLLDKCSACNRANHPPKYIVQLTGKAYDRRSLETLKDTDSDDDSEASVDEKGHEIIDEAREFRLGTFCRSNAMNAHSLIHWRVHLRDWLQTWLRANRYLKSKRILERERWSTTRKARLVDEIMDQLEQDKHIRTLWNDFKAKLAAAPDIHGQRYRR